MVQYDYFEKSEMFYCRVHKISFKKGSSCSSCNTHPLTSDGNVKSNKEVQLTLTNNSRTNTNNSRRVYVRKNIVERFHAYRVKFDADVNWEALFKYEELSLNHGVKFKRIDFPEAIVRVFKKSILITIRSSKEVRGLSVKGAKVISDRMVKDTLLLLPKAIKVKDSKLSSVHNAFINHPYAKKDVKVSVNDEIRFISDNSHGSPEFEAINTNHAISDSEAIERDMVSLIDKGLSRDFIAESLIKLVQDRQYYAENLKSHVEAINELSEGIKEFRKTLKSFKQEKARQLKLEWGW
jgi:hypothetical protein